jgi:hypothetical protein
MRLNDKMRESLIRLWAYAYVTGARRMLCSVTERLREYAAAHAMGEDFDVKAKLMVDALVLEQEALQFGESMVARLERQRGKREPQSDPGD